MSQFEDVSDIVPFTPEVILEAYRHGIFPMGEADSEHVYWFQPDPRALIPLDRYHVPRRLARVLRSGVFDVSYDQVFDEVVEGCAEGRPVWITEKVKSAYGQLHRMGHAHSLEVWQDGELVGGVYGVQLGGAFMAESKFHRVTDASKVALIRLIEHLKERGFLVLEVQYLTDHLKRFGAVEVPLLTYLRSLGEAIDKNCIFGEASRKSK